MYCMILIGEVPSELCAISGLTLLSASGNSGIFCSYLCLTTVTQITLPPTSAQDDGLCGFIAATNIDSLTGYDEWQCTSDGVTSTDPCVGGSEWTGVTCSSSGTVTDLNLADIGLGGSFPTTIGFLTGLTMLVVGNGAFVGEIYIVCIVREFSVY